ncbi:DNA primase small subunit [Teleopsis dalmanni]|uniref:DNA primase small subunit n=1 Tax=Teleopsis dalmanni TaxID=139649 RepID=UPI0018CE5F07|nr:DNA primase small subunit [Teleopsis dalmanni]
MPSSAVESVTDKQVRDDVIKYDINILPDMLPLYYKRLFPHKPFYRWLSYGLSEEDVFRNREFSFTLPDDVYRRYISYETQSDMEKHICKKCPHKIDIGAVMNRRPRNRRTMFMAMDPVQRELVFDIDMTDYDDVRTCCNEANVCQKCWKFMTVAVRILDAALRDDFGFEHIFWVFSGRRGIHAWVCDSAARHLDARSRSAVAEYLQLITHSSTNDGTISRVHIGDRMHHSVKRAFKIVEALFEEIIIEDQNLFSTPKGIATLLHIIPDEKARKDTEDYLRKTHDDGAHSRAVWSSFVRYANSMRISTANIWGRKLKHIVEEVQLAMLYPRLDINVTKGMNHLLKAPFCIHPSTGKVCVPFSASAVAKFNPCTVPTIAQLLQEISAFDDKSKSNEETEDKSRIKDYKKTSMFKGVVVFEEFLRKLESSFKSKAIEISDQKMEF